jgi:redox-sensing transcriptional repressor
MSSISDKTIGRLSLYRRLLNRLKAEGKDNIYSYQLAGLAGGSAARVRRDLMAIGYSGSPSKGYEIAELIKSLGFFLDSPQGQQAALAGIGNLGRAILSYFSGRRPKLAISAAFDNDPSKVNRLIQGCPCFPVEELAVRVEEKMIELGIICVPANQAQFVADQLVHGGVKGILNFAPVRLHLPADVYVEDVNMTTALEKVAFFARQQTAMKRK